MSKIIRRLLLKLVDWRIRVAQADLGFAQDEYERQLAQARLMLLKRRREEAQDE